MGKAGLVARAFGLAIAAMVLGVLVSILWIGIYSFAIEPGHDAAFYQSYARRAAPVSALVSGIPIMALAGWWIARGRSLRDGVWAAALIAILYAVVDGILLLAVAGGSAPWGAAALSYGSKLVAACAGGAWATRSVEPAP